MPSILLLEDNADMLNMLIQVLEWGGHEVMAGRNGTEGLKLMAEVGAPPQLIISDIMMPGMDGTTFLEHVRNHPTWSKIPFVLMSANGSDEERNSAFESGADGFLAKPFSLDDLTDLLQSWNLPADI